MNFNKFSVSAKAASPLMARGKDKQNTLFVVGRNRLRQAG